jgi:hypothetical protein
MVKKFLGFLLWPLKKFMEWLASGLPKGPKGKDE